MFYVKNLLTHLKAKLSLLGGLGSQVSVANLVLMSPILMGGFSELARAGDSLSMPIHYAISILVFTIIWASLEFSTSIGVVTMFVYLVLLGLTRRALIPSTGYISNDPITLVSVFVGGLYFLRLLVMKRLPKYTQISKTVSFLLILMFFEIFNPFQGGISVGFGGIIFRMTPFFWYYVGITKGNRGVLKVIFILIVLLSLLEVYFGFRQTAKLSEIEQFWIAVNRGATQVVTKGVYRSFGTFLSFSEYVIFLSMAAALCWVAFLQRRYLYLIPFSIVAGALIVSSSRTAVINLLLVMVVIWAIQGKNYRAWAPRLIVALVVGLWGMTVGVEKVQEVDVDDRTAVLIQHQVKGLSDPLGKGSTGGFHISLIVNGILSGFTNPIGRGLGAGTVAAAKFGAAQNGAEADYADLFMALGFIGGSLFLVLCFRTWMTMARYWHDTRDTLALSVLALLVACQGNWLSGAHYSQSMILWFAIGAMDRVIWQYRQSVAKEDKQAKESAQLAETAQTPGKLQPVTQ